MPIPPINRTNIDRWKQDSNESVDYYNDWFLRFAPPSFRAARSEAAKRVSEAFRLTNDCRALGVDAVLRRPDLLAVARQLTCPPIARDRLAGLSKVPRTFVQRCEESGGRPLKAAARENLRRVLEVVAKLLDTDVMPWLSDPGAKPTPQQRTRSALVVADRLCGALSDPILRNAQEKRQLDAISAWLAARGYRKAEVRSREELEPGTFAVRLNMTGRASGDDARAVNIPVDVVVLPKSAKRGTLPVLIEAKSAGDFTNVNKRRKEEAQKIEQLRRQYGVDVTFVLFLCGYFDPGYLGYEASERIDWIWEHRIEDMEKLGL